jgi:uncharacterized protein
MDTPCIKVCVIDTGARVCTGCGRTIGEITDWVAMTPVQRQAVMHLLPDRLRHLKSWSMAQGSPA